MEPLRLLQGDGKRPDGATLDPWHSGRYLVWDFTCPDTLAPSHLNHSSQAAGSAAERAEVLKQTKYAELVASGDFLFAPIAIETLGAWGPSALSICAEIGGAHRGSNWRPPLFCLPEAKTGDSCSEGQRCSCHRNFSPGRHQSGRLSYMDLKMFT